MAIVNIPISDNPDTAFTTIFEGVAYDLRLQWNGRDESWQLYIAKQNQPYFLKTKVATGRDVLKTYRMLSDCPKGCILFADNMKQWGRMTRDAFSSGRWSMYYVTSDSLALVEETLANDSDIEMVTYVASDDRFHV